MGFLGKNKPGTVAAANTRTQGQWAEDRALAHLQSAGLRLLARNYRAPGRGGGEIDLVMREPDGTVVFVEVRSRSSQAWGGAGASIGATKQRRIVFAAQHFLLRLGAQPPCRFDAVLLEPDISWIRGAFDAQ